MSTILDISRFQEKMNFTTAALRNVTAVMVRCAYGTAKDAKFDSFAAAAEKAGMPLGAYMFATWHYSSVSKDFASAKKNAASQTQAALSFLSGKKITAPVAVDLELESGAKLEFNKQQLTELTNYVLDLIKKAGYTPLLYCSVSWLYDRLLPEQLSGPFWLAYYYEGAKEGSFPDTKFGKLLQAQQKKLVLWQHSSTGSGSFYGAGSKFIDLNFGFGFEKLIGKGAVAEKPVPQPEKKSLYTIRVKSGSWNVRKSNSMDTPSKAIIQGGKVMQASQKKNGWFYLPEQKGWLGPAAIESWSYNRSYSVYTVVKGDTLSGIAAKFGTTVDRIYDDNKAAYPRMTRDFIVVGWKLKIYK